MRNSQLAGVMVVLELLLPASLRSQGADTVALLAFEDGRFAAMVRADTAWLRGALADDLVYVHSSGRREGKAQYLAAVGAGTMRYQEFTPRERLARFLGPNAAVVTGFAHARAVAGGQPVEVDVRYTAVYERAEGRWRLVAWQTVRVAA